METNILHNCTNCEKPLPQTGFFCGNCLTQFKCKSCNSFLEKDYLGCVMCGTPKELKTEKPPSFNTNTFRLHETSTERTIEASFSDNVGKDLTGILKDAYSTKLSVGQKKEQISFEKKNENISVADVIDDFIPEQEETHNSEKSIQKESIKDTEYPNLRLITIRNLPGSETEWVVVYSFFASNFGKDVFTRQDIIDKYTESNRKTPEKVRDLNSTLKAVIKAGYINPLVKEYALFEKGIEKAKEIITRTASSPARIINKSIKKSEAKNTESKTVKSKTTNNSEIKSLKRLSDINFFPDDVESLEAFYKKFPVANDFERNLIFVYYLSEIQKINKVSTNHIYTCYDALNLRVSENLPQTIRNTRSKTGWIEADNGSNILTMKGRNKIKFWDKES